jgi:hypothetical protein
VPQPLAIPQNLQLIHEQLPYLAQSAPELLSSKVPEPDGLERIGGGRLPRPEILLGDCGYAIARY